MAKQFIIYVDDTRIKTYHQDGKKFSFHAQYALKKEEDIITLCRLLDKRSSMKVYFYIESSEVLFEQRSFSKKNYNESLSVIKAFVDSSENLVSGYVKVAQKNGTGSFSAFAIKNDIYPAVKTLISVLSNNRSKLWHIGFLPLEVQKTNITQNDPSIVNLFVKIRNDNTFSLSAVQGDNFLLFRQDDISNGSISDDINATLAYIATIAAPETKINVTIASDTKLDESEIQKIKANSISTLNESDFGRLNKNINFIKTSDSLSDDNMIACTFNAKGNAINLTNIRIKLKKIFYQLLAPLYFLIFSLLLATALLKGRDLFVEIPQLSDKIDRISIELSKAQKELTKKKEQAIDEKKMAKYEKIINFSSFKDRGLNHLALFKDFSEFANKIREFNGDIFDYSFKCQSECAPSSLPAVDFVIYVENKNGEYEDMVSLVNNIFKAAKENLSGYKLTYAMPEELFAPVVGKKYKYTKINMSTEAKSIDTDKKYIY